MKNLKSGLAVIMALSVLLGLSSCGKARSADYKLPDEFSTVTDEVIAQNSRYSLVWNNESKNVFLKSSSSQKIWGTVPYEYFQTGETSYSLSSPVQIEYYNSNDGSMNTLNALDCIEGNTVSAEKTENGIKVSYWFEEPKISVAFSYTLRVDSLLISLNSDDITEGEINSLTGVSVAPYLCSVKNGTDGDYLFVPAGNGAVMYTDTQPDDSARSFSAEVYGNDPVRKQFDMPSATEKIRLPVYGVKSGNDGLFAIIEEGQGAAGINALAGNPANGYSAVYASFNVRGYNRAELEAYATIILNNKRPKGKVFSVGFYPLENDASYSKMATVYKEYLSENGLLEKSGSAQKDCMITFTGGALKRTFTLGIPHDVISVLTDFSAAEEILKDISKNTSADVDVRLYGFGRTGADKTYVGGGFSFSSKFGGMSGYKSLNGFCRENGIDLYADYDIIQFSKSHNGFNSFRDTALSANMQRAAVQPITKNTVSYDEDAPKTVFLKREKLSDAMERLLESCGKNVDGLSLASLGNLAYSDYSSEGTMQKSALREQFGALIKKASENHKLLLSNPNDYAAGLCDVICDLPTQNGGYACFDEEVPFYALVYRGAIPLYGRALNLSVNKEEQLLSQMEAGIAPAFRLTETADRGLASSYADVSSRTVYENNRNDIAEILSACSDTLARLSDSELLEHTVLSKGVTRSVFAGGKVMYVNHTEKEVTVNGCAVAPKSFRLADEEGVQ